MSGLGRTRPPPLTSTQMQADLPSVPSRNLLAMHPCPVQRHVTEASRTRFPLADKSQTESSVGTACPFLVHELSIRLD